jgi:signal transduction histidine kinase
LGVLSLIGTPGSAYNEEAVSLLLSISDQIGIAIENHRLHEQAQEAAVLSERQRLARDLHDSVTQSLYSLNLMAETGQKMLVAGSDPDKIARTLDRIGTTAHNALKEMRLLLYHLKPTALEKEGLVEALRQRLEAVEGRAAIKTTLNADHLPKLLPELEEGLYHIAQEALNNALKHACCTQTDVSIRCEEEWIDLEIHDNGKGLAVNGQENNQGIGLASMSERARLLRGELTIDSKPDAGTRIRVRVRIPPEVA